MIRKRIGILAVWMAAMACAAPAGLQPFSIETEAAGAALEEQQAYQQDGITITVTGLDTSGFMGPEVTLLLENDSDKNVIVQTRKSSVNGYMQEFMMSVDLAAGKKANDSITMMSDELEACGIETISEIEFCFSICDPDTFETLAVSDPVILHTTGTEDYVQEYDDEGEVIYENNGLKIVSKGTDEDSFMGTECLLYFENTSDKDLTVQADNTSVNGFMIDPIMSVDIQSGKHALDGIMFLSTYLEDNKIETIEEVETSFHIFETDDYTGVIEDTDPIVITYGS